MIICFEEFQKQWGVFGFVEENLPGYPGLDSWAQDGGRNHFMVVRWKGLSYTFLISFSETWRSVSLALSWSQRGSCLDWTKPPQVSKRENSKHKTESFSVILSFLDSSIFFSFLPLPSSLLWHHLPHLGNLPNVPKRIFTASRKQRDSGTSPLSPWWTQITYSNRGCFVPNTRLFEMMPLVS